MFNYDEAKKYLIEHLSQDVALHLSGNTEAVGRNFDEFDGNLPRNAEPKFKKLHIALNFWDGWQDSRNHDWLYYEGINQSDWPNLAKEIVTDIENDRDITNEQILSHFDLRPRTSVIEKIKSLFQSKASA